MQSIHPDNFEVIHDYITDGYNILFVAKKLE